MKSLTFLGPIHHLNTLAPVVQACEARGVTNRYYTANAEAAFEYTLTQKLQYEWDFLPLYADRERADSVYQTGVDYFRSLCQSPSAVTAITPPILDRILREIANDTWATKLLLEKVQPDFCLALHELSRWPMLLGYWCETMGIPFWTIQEGMYYGPSPLYVGHTRYSKSLIWGEATRHVLLAAGCPDERLCVVGHPGLGARWKAAETAAEEARALLPPSFAGKKLAFFYVTNLEIKSVDVPALLEGFAESEWRMIIRVAVMSNRPLIEKITTLFAPYADLCYVSAPFNDLALPLAALADVVCVWGCSTLTLESLWRGKPTAEVSWTGQPFSFAQAGVAFDASNPRTALEWITGVQALFADPAHQQKVQEFCLDHIKEGDAADLIADIILRR